VSTRWPTRGSRTPRPPGGARVRPDKTARSCTDRTPNSPARCRWSPRRCRLRARCRSRSAALCNGTARAVHPGRRWAFSLWGGCGAGAGAPGGCRAGSCPVAGSRTRTGGRCNAGPMAGVSRSRRRSALRFCDGDGLERLLPCCAEPPFALEWLETTGTERRLYHLPRPVPDGRPMAITRERRPSRRWHRPWPRGVWRSPRAGSQPARRPRLPRPCPQPPPGRGRR
jgi:hypothetical protein